MEQQPQQARRWNLFARELEDCLCEHGRDLNDLVSEAGLHPEKVRRLKQSLAQPRFHILNPEELEQVSVSFAFTGKEQLRLRAAILATAVEETLMNRIDSENALHAAEEIFPLLVEALQQRYGRLSGLAATRGTSMNGESPLINEELDQLLRHFDEGMLALHLGRQSQADHERLVQATLAQDRFMVVLTGLDALSVRDPMMKQDDDWQLWHQEAQKSLAMIKEDLLRLQL